MKLKYLFIIMTLAACQKEQKKTQTANFNPTEIPEVAETGAKEVEKKPLHTDTILLSEDKSSNVNHILVNLMEKEVDKDSIVTSKFRLDFYQTKTKVASSKVEIKQYEKGAEWYGSFGLTDSSDKNSLFIKITSGYPACGYTHDNYLYYLKNNDLQLVHQWYSMSDSGWGSWTEFASDETGKDPKNFYCKTVAFEPSDDDSEDSGIVTYSDSISFSLKGDKWKKKLLSAKETPYFEKKMSFNEFHKQE
ncbi:hypothetical protein L1276_001423 [Flavobacterium sp. HSC-32F16]|uniref:hypothetical protein n=1 Tax=Flavobacterium sp. HSC-32F16 TaxID=2910964 RepID=UPI0020A59AE5|nr:hypothetical protein [Flavobacterium sp. HSC-32F16]MCP2026279.1 hypothetical protein [Flavobacterium sp. HSC-32F16]